MPMPPALLLLLLLLGSAAVHAHRPMTNGTSGGVQFSTWDSALELPYITASWALDRIVDCANPFVWLKFKTDPTAGTIGSKNLGVKYNSTSRIVVQFGAGTPLLPSLSGLRSQLSIIGPGLQGGRKLRGKAKKALGMNSTPPGRSNRVLTFRPTTDLSSCAFVTTLVLKAAYNVTGSPPRCTFHEDYGDTLSYVLMDHDVPLLVNRTYYVAAYLHPSSTGRMWLDVSDLDQSEDFTTPYTAPTGARADADKTFFTDPTPPTEC